MALKNRYGPLIYRNVPETDGVALKASRNPYARIPLSSLLHVKDVKNTENGLSVTSSLHNFDVN